MKIDANTKVLGLAVLIAGVGAAAWFLYLEEMVFGPDSGPVASAPKPAAVPAKPAAVPAKPAAEAPKPAAVVAAAPAPTAPAPATPTPVAAAVQPVAAAPVAPKSAPAPAKPVVAKEAQPIKAEQPAKAEPVAEARAPAKEATVVPVRMAAGPVYESKMRFNDLVTAVLYQDAGAVNDLLAFGKWPDKADSAGMTPLMIAVSLGQTEIAQALLKAGADPQRAGPGGVTAMSIARERRDAALLGLLQGKR